MSGEIEFRAWDKKKKRMLYGVSIGTIKVWDENTPLISHEFSYSEDCIFEQYTGLEDKNGKKIYVGDILETCCGKAEVYFDDELLMYRIKVRHGGTMPLVSKKSKRHFDYEVIGNVHENPELLEVK